MSELVELWTLQDVRILCMLKRTGVLRADGRRVGYGKDARPAYRWLIQQMSDRIDGYHGGYPIWAWPEKPDLRRSKYAMWNGRLSVRIGFRVQRSRALIFDLDTWHCILHGGPITLCEQEFNLSDHWNPGQIKQTWQRVFDLPLLERANSAWLGPAPRDTQVVLGEIYLSDIFHIDLFRSVQPKR